MWVYFFSMQLIFPNSILQKISKAFFLQKYFSFNVCFVKFVHLIVDLGEVFVQILCAHTFFSFMGAKIPLQLSVFFNSAFAERLSFNGVLELSRQQLMNDK